MNKRIICLMLISLLLLTSGCSSKKEESKMHADFVSGFQPANYEKMNSYSSHNYLDGTKVWLDGTFSEIDILNIEYGECYCAIVNDSDNHRWFVLLEAEVFGYIEDYERYIGKPVTIIGFYTGYSNVKRMPTITLYQMLNEESKEAVVSNFASFGYSYELGLSDYEVFAHMSEEKIDELIDFFDKYENETTDSSGDTQIEKNESIDNANTVEIEEDKTVINPAEKTETGESIQENENDAKNSAENKKEHFSNTGIPILECTLDEVVSVAKQFGVTYIPYEDMDLGDGLMCRSLTSNKTMGLSTDIMYIKSTKQVVDVDIVTNLNHTNQQQKDYILAIAKVACPSNNSEEVYKWLSAAIGTESSIEIEGIIYNTFIGNCNNYCYNAGETNWENWYLSK